MNLMKSMKDVRTTSHFRDYALAEIKIAYRIKEYLTPDNYFPPNNLNNVTKLLLCNGEYREAVQRIIDKELYIDIESSSAYEDLVDEGIEFIESLKDKTLEEEQEVGR